MKYARKFEEYHAANPEVYDHLVRFAREARERDGMAKIGISVLINRLRWYMDYEAEKTEGFKIGASTAAFYARLIMRRETDLDGLFDLRPAEADIWIALRYPPPHSA